MPKQSIAKTPELFEAWLYKSQGGDTCIYYTGFLYVDRCWANSGSKSQEAMNARSRIAAANRAWKNAQDGFVALTQRKIDDMEYEYIATRLS
ncbi:MAG: hypothetical protein RLZZ599_1448 [Bacteroidota bacterium]|jgi:hypothetical protein